MRFLLFSTPSPEDFANRINKIGARTHENFDNAKNYTASIISDTYEYYKNTYEQISYFLDTLKTTTNTSVESNKIKQFLYDKEGKLLLTYNFNSKKVDFPRYLDSLINTKILEQIKENNRKIRGENPTLSQDPRDYAKMEEEITHEMEKEITPTIKRYHTAPDILSELPDEIPSNPYNIFFGLQPASDKTASDKKEITDLIPRQVNKNKLKKATLVKRGPNKPLDPIIGKRSLENGKNPHSKKPPRGGKTRRKVRRNKKTKTKKRKVNKKTKKRKMKMKSKRKTNKRKTNKRRTKK
jgi:hypothetical protein